MYDQNGFHVVLWAMVLDWECMVVELVVVELQQEVVEFQLEVVEVQVWVETAGLPCESWMPLWSRSCGGFPEE